MTLLLLFRPAADGVAVAGCTFTYDVDATTTYSPDDGNTYTVAATTTYSPDDGNTYTVASDITYDPCAED